MDITLGTVLLVGLLPIIAVVALAVLLLLFQMAALLPHHKRVGRHGRPFHMLKFRTMVNGAHHMLADLLEAKPMLAREYEERLKAPEDRGGPGSGPSSDGSA